MGRNMPSDFRDSKVKGIVFDLDGTLVDSNIDYYRMKERTISLLGNEGIPKELLSRDLSIADIMERAHGFLGDGSANEVWSRIEDSFRAIELQGLNGLKPIEGVISLMDRIDESGYKVGVLTRASRRYAERALQTVGLQNTINHMICRDDFPWYEAKPAPIAMERLTALLDTSPPHCLLVGDHYLDMRCALDSGAMFIGVLSGSYTMDQWNEAGCEQILTDVSEIESFLF